MKNCIIILCSFFVSLALWARTGITIVTEDYPPYNFENSMGAIDGLSTDVVKALLKETGVDAPIVLYPWARAYNMAQEKPDVLIYSIGRNSEREALGFKWIGPIAPWDIFLYTLKDGGPQPATLQEAKSYRIGAVREDFRAQELVKNGFILDLVKNDTANLEKLFARRIDLMPDNEAHMVFLIKRLGHQPSAVMKTVVLSKADLYLAFSPLTTEETYQVFLKAFDTIKKKGLLNQIQKRWTE